MPERSGVPNIADQHLRRRSSEGQAVPQPKYHLQHLRSFADRETGPRSAEARRGPSHLPSRAIPGPAQCYAGQSFQKLRCAFAPTKTCSEAPRSGARRAWPNLPKRTLQRYPATDAPSSEVPPEMRTLRMAPNSRPGPSKNGFIRSIRLSNEASVRIASPFRAISMLCGAFPESKSCSYAKSSHA
jgi:hypothetical protein